MKTSSSLTREPFAAAKDDSARLRHRPRTRNQQRERFYMYLKEHPLDKVDQDEMDAHFQGMPKRYWESVTKNELVWGLETIHAFFKALAAADFPGTPVVANWRHCPERGFTKVMVCTWDRPKLLAKVAAAFSALRINILQADVFTRADNVVLDVFQVSDLQHAHLSDAAVLDHLKFLLEGALKEPPTFMSLWAAQFHKVVDRAPGSPCRVEFDNEGSDDYTVLRLEASDRLGLLYDALQGLMECEVNIAQAILSTEKDAARDVFYVTDLEGRKIKEAARLAAIEQALTRAIDYPPESKAGDPQPAST